MNFDSKLDGETVTLDFKQKFLVLSNELIKVK